MSDKIKNTKRVRLTLKSKANKRTMELTKCYECKRVRSPAWLYFKSNRGPVHLCMSCEAKVLDRSFGRIDAMDKAVHFGHYNARDFKR